MTARGPIEFWGYPGSGKSSVVAELRKNGYVQRKSRPIAGKKMIVLASAFDNMPTLVTLLAYLRWKASLRGDPVIGQLRRTSVIQSIQLYLEPDRLVLEEGIVHQLWRCLYQKPDWILQEWWQKHLALSCSTIVILDVSPRCAWERIRQKTHPGSINKQLLNSRPGAINWLKAEEAYKAIQNELTDKHDRRVIRIDGERLSVDETCSALLSKLSP